MASAASVHQGYVSRPSRRDRAVSLSIALGIVALMILALIRMGVITNFTPPEQRTKIFEFGPPAENAEQPKPKVATSRAPRPTRQPAPSAPPAPAKQVVKTPAPAPTTPAFIQMDSGSFAASDISKIHGTAGDSGHGAEKGSGEGASVYGPGEGPGGQRLYPVAWYREPTHAELAGYLPHNGVSGYADIACRMIDHYHVDNCRSLGETPGSGLARALRLASWQFLVRPPRINGQPQIGAMVRIHFDFTETVEKGPPQADGPSSESSP